MKIIQYIPYSYSIHPGGLEKIAQTLCDGLNIDQQTTCINIASNIKKGTNIIKKKNNEKLVPSFDLISGFPVPKIWSKKFRQNIQLIKEEKPEIIITHTRFFIQSMIGGLIAKRLGCKRVHVEHGSGFVIGYPRHIRACARLFDWTVGLRIFRQCDQIITISEMHKKFIRKFTCKIPVVIYNPIDYQPQEKVRSDIPHIGFIGRLVPLKGVDLLIQALKQIENKKRICTIVGTGSEDEKLKNLTQLLGLSDHIRFIGADDRSNRLHEFDIFINPSYQEGVPTTVVEALIAGCIVGATDVGGTREISDADDLIIIKTPGDNRSENISNLKKGVEKAFDRLNKSGDSLQIATKKFSPDKVIGQYNKVLEKITHQK